MCVTLPSTQEDAGGSAGGIAGGSAGASAVQRDGASRVLERQHIPRLTALQETLVIQDRDAIEHHEHRLTHGVAAVRGGVQLVCWWCARRLNTAVAAGHQQRQQHQPAAA